MFSVSVSSAKCTCWETSAVPEWGPRKVWRRVAFAGVMAVILAAAAWVVSLSPVFRAHDIVVEGYSELTRPQVLRLAQISDATNVLWLSTGTVEERLLEDPWIAEATVSKDLPSGIRVMITERVPSAVVQQGSIWTVLANDGLALEQVTRDPHLPRILGGAAPTVGAQSETTTAAAVFGGYMDNATRVEVDRIIVESDSSLRLETVSGARVTLGPPVELWAKAEALRGILVWAAENHARIRSVDLTTPDAPAARVDRHPSG